jgi:hypothetical protein
MLHLIKEPNERTTLNVPWVAQLSSFELGMMSKELDCNNNKTAVLLL